MAGRLVLGPAAARLGQRLVVMPIEHFAAERIGRDIRLRTVNQNQQIRVVRTFFVDDTKWAHLDIAGVAWSKKDQPTVPKGATAYGVRLLDRFVESVFEGNTPAK